MRTPITETFDCYVLCFDEFTNAVMGNSGTPRKLGRSTTAQDCFAP